MIDPILSRFEIENIKDWFWKERKCEKIDGLAEYYMQLLIAEVERYQEKYNKK